MYSYVLLMMGGAATAEEMEHLLHGNETKLLDYKLQPTRCNFSWIYLCLQTLYMFQGVPPPVIRGT